MRSHQKNNRSRGRGNNNNRNKNANPLTRSYDSNGPDVRVRGNASTVAEKYMQLARDAQSAGDSVAAENYLQHAEHYFRIISAAQVQQLAQQQAQAARAEQQQANRQDNRSSNQPVTQHGNVPQNSEGEAKEISSEANSPDKGGFGGGDKPNNDRPKRERRPRRRPVGDKPAVEKAAVEKVAVEKPVVEKPVVEKSVVEKSVVTSEETAGDPANAPQPEVSDLPDFVTSAPDSSAAE